MKEDRTACTIMKRFTSCKDAVAGVDTPANRLTSIGFFGSYKKLKGICSNDWETVVAAALLAAMVGCTTQLKSFRTRNLLFEI